MRLAALLLLCACSVEKSERKVVVEQVRPAPPTFTTPPDLLALRADMTAAPPAFDPGTDPTKFVTTRCPPDMAPIPIGGCIDRYEASAGKGQFGGSDASATTVVAESAAGRKPLVDVTIAQARRACANAKKSLCEESQWRSACKYRLGWRHVDVETYAYGRGYQAGRCRDYTSSEAGRLGPALTGAFSRCVTAGGVFDLSGNVAELVGTPEESGYVAFGGAYHNSALDTSCDEDDDMLKPSEHRPDVGFRCCSAGIR